jgi:hypothetical protein
MTVLDALAKVGSLVGARRPNPSACSAAATRCVPRACTISIPRIPGVCRRGGLRLTAESPERMYTDDAKPADAPDRLCAPLQEHDACPALWAHPIRQRVHRPRSGDPGQRFAPVRRPSGTCWGDPSRATPRRGDRRGRTRESHTGLAGGQPHVSGCGSCPHPQRIPRSCASGRPPGARPRRRQRRDRTVTHRFEAVTGAVAGTGEVTDATSMTSREG